MNRLHSLLHELPGLRETLPVRLQEAASNRLAPEEFLTLVLQDEVNVRHQRQIERRVKVADFRKLKPLDEFDWRFNPSISKKPIYELAACHLIRAKTDALFIGPPGVGKTMLAQAIGCEAIKQCSAVCYRSIFDLVRDFLADHAPQQRDRVLNQYKYIEPDLTVIDDMGLRALPKQSGEYLLEVIMRRYETRSTIMTTICARGESALQTQKTRQPPLAIPSIPIQPSSAQPWPKDRCSPPTPSSILLNALH